MRAGRMDELALHPTVKPLPMIADAIGDVSARGDIVLDTFGGSGSTLIAAHKTGRRGFLCELDEQYCDTIIDQWQTYAGDISLDIVNQSNWLVACKRNIARSRPNNVQPEFKSAIRHISKQLRKLHCACSSFRIDCKYRYCEYIMDQGFRTIPNLKYVSNTFGYLSW